MSLFGIQQVASLFTPRATKAFDEVGRAMEAELDGTLRAAFRAGDRWQKNLVDLTLGGGTGRSVQSPAPEPPPITQPAAEAISPDYPFAPHYVDVLGSRMHYIEQGTGDPILLLHGNPTWSYTWRNIIPHLSPLGRCIAPDLIGYGRSDKPRIEYRWVDHVRYLEGFIQAMGLRDITLVLHDQGSGLGFHYAMRHESNVRAIAFFEAIVRPYPWEKFSTPEFREIFRRFRTGGVGGEGWQMLVEQNMFIEQLLPQAAGRPLTEQEMSFYREPFRDPGSRVPVWRFPRETPIGGEPPDVWQAVTTYSERLQASRLPKLMLYATPGALLTSEHVAWCQQNIRNLESVHLGAGSHFLQESSPHRIGREVAAWLHRLRGADMRASRPHAGAPVSPSGDENRDAQAIQDLVDCAAHFNMFSTPERSTGHPAILAPGSSHRVIGIKVHEVLHRFGLVGQAPTSRSPLTARKGVGEAVARFTHRWMLVPPGFVSSPDREPPPTSLDPSCSQRFVMLDSLCTFGQGESGFRSFGTGQTFPTIVNGQPQLLATAVGIITEGFGQFRGHEEGTFVYCGTLSPERGFTGNVLLRVMDPRGTFRAEGALPAPEAGPDPEPEISYLIFRGQAVPTDPVLPKLGADRQQTGLIVHQGMRLLDVDCALTGSNRLQSTTRPGQWIGRITAGVTFDPTSARGTIQDPIPFTSLDEFIFNGEDGQTKDSFTADSSEGRVFNTQLGGFSGIRFGGIGRILGGTGSFAGIEGLMTDNSVVVFAPHVSASVYVLRIHDPRGKFRAKAK